VCIDCGLCVILSQSPNRTKTKKVFWVDEEGVPYLLVTQDESS